MLYVLLLLMELVDLLFKVVVSYVLGGGYGVFEVKVAIYRCGMFMWILGESRN